MKHIQTQSEWEEQMAYKLFEYMKSEVYLDLPYLSFAMSSLSPSVKENVYVFSTDGNSIWYEPNKFMDLFKKNTLFLERAFLHTVFHCLFLHLWMKKDRDQYLWNICCDIMVEYTIDHLEKPCTKRILSYLRMNTYKELEQLKGVTAPNIYVWLLDKNENEIISLQKEFYTDDHRYWPKEDKKSISNTEQKWRQISKATSMDQKRKGNDESKGEQILIHEIETSKSKRSYKDFLEKFSSLHEEMKVDMDSFDLSLYTYGLNLYENMPLIEPLESKEEKKIREFVIVLDTSYSTDGKLVESFLKETCAILSMKSFFSKSKIHILQCDNRVLSHTSFESKEDMDKMINTFTLVGGGGTDFRPAFEYVEELKIKELSGMIYFTDGKGIYPKKRPNFKCAFVFLDEYNKDVVPPWAICHELDVIELLEGK